MSLKEVHENIGDLSSKSLENVKVECKLPEIDQSILKYQSYCPSRMFFKRCRNYSLR